MEILAGFLAGTITVIYFYKESLKKEEKLKLLIDTLNYLKKMDEKTENRLWEKIEKMDEDITGIKVSMATLKTKVFFITGIASFVASTVVAIASKFI